MNSRVSVADATFGARPMALLTLHHFRVAFRQKTVLSSVDLELFPGVPQVLVGPVAAGKSTLLRTLAGLNFSGEAVINGDAMLAGRPLSPSNHISLVGQRAASWIGSVADGLAPHDAQPSDSQLPKRASSLPRPVRLERAVAMLERLHLDHLKDRLARPMLELSTLDARLALLARFAAEGPTMLALDEPTTGMSHAELFHYCATVREVAMMTPVLVATHNQLVAREIGGNIALLAGGRIVEASETHSFFHAPKTASAKQYARTGSCPSPSPDTDPDDVDPDLRQRFPELFDGPRPSARDGALSREAPPSGDEFLRPCESFLPPSGASASNEAVSRRTPTVPYLGSHPEAKTLELLRESLVARPEQDDENARAPHGDDTTTALTPEPVTAVRRTRGPVLASRIQPAWVFQAPTRLAVEGSPMIPARLGGCRRPGLLAELDDDLEDLREAGVNVLVSLEAEHRISSAEVSAHGIVHHQVPFADMKAPAAHDMIDLCIEIDSLFARNLSVCVHCKAGLGRTGTVLAGYLIWKGLDVYEAIATIRKREPKFVSTEAQEQFLVALSAAIHIQRLA